MGETVLVVDDQEDIRVLLQMILTRGGYRVLLAADGLAAVAVAEEHDGAIDLLITDVMMPRMVGDEVAARICALRAETRVLFMSGYVEPVLAGGGNRIPETVRLLKKPFTRAALLAEVDATLGGS